MDEASAIQAVARYLDATNRDDIQGMVACTSPQFEFRTPRSVLHGPDELRASMEEPRRMNAVFEPQRWFARGGEVVCFMLGRYTWVESGDSAGEGQSFMRALVGQGGLELVRVGYENGEAALADAGLGEADERLTGVPGR